MKELPHGGDIYSIPGPVLDFSANINPLGIPEGVKQAVVSSVEGCVHYPDPLCRELRRALSEHESVPPDWLVFGNGAADLIFRLVWAVRPKRAVTAEPTFLEYGFALESSGCHIVSHRLRREEGFAVTRRLLDDLTPGTDLLFLCNPNNPTGRTIDPALLLAVVHRCAELGIRIVLDECFQDFLDDPNAHTLIPLLKEFPHVVILKAFTKIYAIPGLRLGYTLCSDPALVQRLEQCGQPWAVSIPAQAAGVAALRETKYLERTRNLIRSQRERMIQELRLFGMDAADSEANYVFFRAPRPGLREFLLDRGILIRSCANYPGLDEYDFRAAVRLPQENSRFLAACREF